MTIYTKMQEALKELSEEKGISDNKIEVSCKALTVKEAIGETEHNDYPIQKGREVMVEADFRGAKGQAFTDEYSIGSYRVNDLINLDFKGNKDRAIFIACVNAIWKYYNKAEKTIHCKDAEPVKCAGELHKHYDFTKKTLLVGLQPRFLEVLAENGEVRAVDLDKDNIGRVISGVEIEDGEDFDKIVEWCDQIFATGSTLCNDSTQGIIDSGKPVTFFGITIAAAAEILGLNTYCECGH